MYKETVIKKFNLSKKEVFLIDSFLKNLSNTNKTTNLVGKSTIKEAWGRHICDSLQLIRFLDNKKDNIVDMGAGAGIPGIIMSIMGFKSITMIESTKKKALFISNILSKLEISGKIINQRIENTKINPAKFIICRALAPLDKLFNYSLFFSNKNTTLLFLKGRSVKKEIMDAKKNYYFDYELYPSASSKDGSVIQIKNFIKR